MGFTKEQVEQHIAGVERRLLNEQERNMHGFRFAKMCYQAKMYGDAIRYLSGYLSVQERDPSAHKFMGRVCEVAEHPEKAIVHYRRSLALKKNQRDVIVSVAELYCKLEKPPLEEVKDCLRLVESVMKGHPLVMSLNEKLHLLQGTSEGSSMEDLITKQLAVSSQDTSLHIRLVQLYTSSGNLPNAFRYCQLMGEKGTFTDSPAWQSCVMDASEKYFQHLKASGCADSVRLLEVLVMVLEGASALFSLVATGQGPSLAQCAAVLLKFDKVLHAAVILLRPPCPPTPYRAVVRELCGRLYHMAAEYLFTSGSRRQHCVGVWQNEHLKMFGLGELCLLASLKATPPRMEGEWSIGAANKSLLKKWHTAACKRLCLVGHHLMLVAASKPEGYINELPKEIGKEGGRLDLIRMLFSNNQHLITTTVYFGTEEIGYSLKESFLAEDVSLSNAPTELPDPEDLAICDQVFVSNSRADLRGLLWLCVAHRALGMKPPVSEWLAELFEGVKLDANDLGMCEAHTLCLCDLEGFLVLLTAQHEAALTIPPYQLLSASSPSTPSPLHSSLMHVPPSSLELEASDLSWWSSVIALLGGDISVHEAVPLKRDVQTGLARLRGCRPLQLNLQQLATLARHFKQRAESLVDAGEGHYWNYRDIINVMLKWSSNYWKIIISAVQGKSEDEQSLRKGVTKKPKPLLMSVSPTSKQGIDSQALLGEARMALAAVALQRQDTSRALSLYSRIKTPHAAWNESQIYLFLAEQEGGQESPRDAMTRLSNLEKASRSLAIAISRLSPSESPMLREKLTKQQEEVRQLIDDAKKTPVACSLQFDSPTEGSPPSPEPPSTPTGEKTSPGSQKETPPVPTGRKTSSDSPGEAPEKKGEQAEQIAALAAQLQQLQDEMQELKKSHLKLSTPPTRAKALAELPLLTPPPVAAIPPSPKASPKPSPSYSTSPSYSAIHSPAASKLLPSQHSTPISKQSVTFQTSPVGITHPLIPQSGSAWGIPQFTGSSPPYQSLSSQQRAEPFFATAQPQYRAQQFSLATQVPLPQQKTDQPPSLFQGSFSPQFQLGGMSSLGASPQQPLQHFPSPSTTAAASQPGLSTFSAHFQLSGTTKPVFPLIQPRPPLTTVASHTVQGLTFQSADSTSNSFQQPFTFSSLTQGSTPSFNFQAQPQAGAGSSFIPTSSVVPRLSHPQEPQPSMLPLLNTSSPTYSPSSPAYAFPAFSFSASSTATAVTASGTTSGITGFPLLSSLLSPPSSASSTLHTTLSLQFQSPASLQPVSTQPFTFEPSAAGDTGLSSLGKSLFVSSTAAPTLGALGQSYIEEVDGDGDGEEEESRHDTSLDTSGGPDFTIVSLPKLAEIKSGEEDEDVLFSHRAKLFRFETKSKEWKERGVGDMKILRHKATGKARLLMRRDQVLKICCNHHVTEEVKLTPMTGPSSSKSWTWYTSCDFADGVPKPEKLAIRFKQPETAQEFKTVLDKCIEETLVPERTSAAPASTDSTSTASPLAGSLAAKFAPPPGGWICEICYVQNDASALKCAACQNSKPGQVVPPPTQPGRALPLSIFSKFALPGSWTCEMCYIQNQPDAEKCVACGGKNPAVTSSASTPSPVAKPLSAPATGPSQTQPFAIGGGMQVPALKTFTLQPSTPRLQPTTDASQPPVAGGIRLGTLNLASLQQLASSSQATSGAETTPKSEPSGGIKIEGFKLPSFPPSSSGGRTDFQPISLTGLKLPGFTPTASAGEEQAAENEDEHKLLEFEPDVYFKPVVKLSESVDVKLGEEEEGVLFSHRARLYRFDEASKQWKERGTGSVKILEHQTTGKIRVLMRRDQVLKICCNHYITAGMSLNPQSGSNTSWNWYTSCDFADEQAKPEKLAIRFKTSDTAQQFKTVFDECVQKASDSQIKTAPSVSDPQPTSIPAQSFLSKLAPAPGSWDCDACYVSNEPESSKCVACGTVKPITSTQPSVPTTVFPEATLSTTEPIDTKTLSSKLAPPPGSWICDACYVSNEPESSKCVACGTIKPITSTQPSVPTTVLPEATLSPTEPIDTKTLFSENPKLAPPPGAWICDDCYVSNRPESGNCVACGATRPASETSPTVTVLTESDKRDSQSSDEESVVVTEVDMPSPEKIQLAEKYMLPPTFYNYENKPPCPGCRGCTDEDGSPLYAQDKSPGVRVVAKKETVDEESDREDEKQAEEADEAIEERRPEQRPASPKALPTETKGFGGFFSSTSGFSFADLAASSSGSDSTSIFGQTGSKSPGFARAGEVMFSQSPTHREDYNPEAEANVHFKPLVDLPELAAKTGEEEEEAIFSHRAKLFRYDNKISQWKERGVGDMKLLRNKATSKTRVIMRRDQVLKICCNHTITAEMNLIANAGSDKSWTWHTLCDFADEVAKPEKLAVRFKHAETAQQFKEAFDSCVGLPAQKPQPLRAASVEKDSTVRETAAQEQEVEERKPLSVIIPDEALMQRLAPPVESWSCRVCYIENTKNFMKCDVCGSLNPAQEALASKPTAVAAESPLQLPLDLGLPMPTPTTLSSPLRLPLDLGPQVVHCKSEPSPLMEQEPEIFSSPQVLGLVHTTSTTRGEDTDSPVASQVTQKSFDSGDVSWSTVEENDEEMFSRHGRLLVEDVVAKDWKEKGSGEMKVIRHTPTGKLKLLMLSEDPTPTVLCAHSITSLMRLRGTGRDNEWVWCSAADYATGKANRTVQKFCLELDSAEAAVEFKQNFEAGSSDDVTSPARLRASQDDPQLLSDEDETEAPIPEPSLLHPPPLMQIEKELTKSEDEAVFLYEEFPDPDLVRKAEEFMLPKSFYLYEKKPPCPGCRGCRDEIEYPDSSASKPTEPGGPAAVAEHSSSTAAAAEEGKELGVANVTEQQPQLPHEAVGQTAAQEETPKPLPFQRGPFSSAGMVSFADLSSSGFGSGFGQRSPDFKFQGSGRQLFAPKKEAAEMGENDPEAEVEIHFKPIASLPKTYAFTSWDDEVEVLFSHRAKLFRFDAVAVQWKERGVGDIKIAKHRRTGRVRIIMRRDQILKICCNHYITPDMSLSPMNLNDKSWVWLTQSDFSDETPKAEKLAVRFKHVEKAREFKEVFDMCLAKLSQDQSAQPPRLETPQIHPKGSSESLASKFQPGVGSWECGACYVQNTAENTKCVACGTNKESSESDETLQPLTCAGLASQLSAFQESSEASEVTFGSSGGIKLSLPHSISPLPSQSQFQPISQGTLSTSSTGFQISSTPDCPSTESQ